jgi:4'-phosphopantetheinyl transferase
MNRDGIADPPYLDAPKPPGRDEAHVWRVELPATEGRAAARRALREILAAYLGQAPDAVELTIGESGKPGLAGWDRGAPGPGAGRGEADAPIPASAAVPLSFNLSHSGRLALVAVAAGGTAVGVDVERLRRRRDLARLAARWLPAEDAEAVTTADEGAREELFYAAWTRHEARAKCSGAGLSGPPPGPEIVAQELVIDRGYAAAIAFDLGETRGMPRVTLRQG